MRQYKCHILPFVEHSTPAVYHASKTLLDVLDKVQQTFLRRLEFTEETALVRYNLAPLSSRRDMAMLGVVHRTVLGEGPPHFRKWFFPAEETHSYPTRLQTNAHRRQLHDYLDGSHSALLQRSALGLPRVYNRLPANVVQCSSVKTFQRELQTLLKKAAEEGELNWATRFSPRSERAVRFAA